MKIPVFHDDQHGTAIISAAAFLNALEIDRQADRRREGRLSRGAGAAGDRLRASSTSRSACSRENILHVRPQAA